MKVENAPKVVTGWTAPWTLHDRATQLDTHISAFDIDVRALDRTKFARLQTDWSNWLAGWKKFYAGLTGLRGAVDYLGVSQLSSDDVAAQIESYRNDLEAFQLRYKNESGEVPKTIPAPGAPQAPNTSPPKDEHGFEVPWWAWVGVGVLVMGGVWYATRKVGQAARIAKFAMGRDPGLYLPPPVVYPMPSMPVEAPALPPGFKPY